MAKLSAYTMQNEALFAFSTVLETISFAANLRLPASMTAAEKRKRVDAVIQELGLNKTRDTIVGGTFFGGEARGISGGERKRVGIAVDLLHNPPIVFLDEPTSGLDSFQALQVMKTVCSLARNQGRTVVTSVHQPRSSIWAMLDHVLLLSDGRTVYAGPAGGACSSFFADAGHPVPENFNPADHFLDVISVDFRTDELARASSMRRDALVQRFEDKGAPDSGTCDAAMKTKPGNRRCERDATVNDRPAGQNFFVAFALLLRRSWREQTRDKTTLGIKYFMNTFFTLLFGVVYFRMGSNQTSLQDRTGILFFTAMNMAFGASINISQVIPLQLRVISRERHSRMYGVLPYFVATFLIAIPLELVPQFLYSCIMYYMTNLRSGLTHFLIFAVIMSLENLVAIGLGMALSAAFRSVEMAGQIAPAVVILFLVFSGYMLNEESIPVFLSPLKYVSFIRYAFQALAVNEFEGRDFDCNDAVGGTTGGSCTGPPCLSGDDWLEQLNFDGVNIWFNCGILVIEMAFFNLLAYFILWKKGKNAFMNMNMEAARKRDVGNRMYSPVGIVGEGK
jgi:ABC-type multidrug transport system ATPase subunit